MFELFTSVFIFCIVLFIYLHVHFHLKKSNDLEIYEIEHISKNKLEEICDLRQPVLFDFDDDKILQVSNKEYLLNNFRSFEVKIRNSKDTDYESEIYMPLPFHSAIKLFTEDKLSTYFSENNSDFLQETGINKIFQYNDEFVRPYMVSNCNYDILFGSNGTITPLRYELNYRNYFYISEGSVTIKLAPPKNSKYLYTVYDYENFEFRSPINVWSPQEEYISDFDKIKFLEVNLTKGKIIQIPAYWWYSIKFNVDSCISSLKYRTYMNNLAITPNIILHGLQLQNIKRYSVKKIDIKEINNKTSDENVESSTPDEVL